MHQENIFQIFNYTAPQYFAQLISYFYASAK